jgi:hypothetical protein
MKNRITDSNYKYFYFIIFILFFYLLWFNYYRIQLLYDVNVLGSHTPEKFTIPKGNENEYNKRVHMGVKEMLLSRIILCSLLRDVEDRIPMIIEKVENMGKIFKDYRVLIVENDSKDNTRNLLLEWASRNNKVIILGCGINVNECHLNLKKTEGHAVDRTRIEKMVYLRNLYLNEIKKNYSNWDYFAVWDLDIIGSVYLDGLANSFGYLTKFKNPYFNIDAMCAYGIKSTPFTYYYYDPYAHVKQGGTFHINEKLQHALETGYELLGLQRGETPLKVDSCFGGFTIYKIKSILLKNAEYGTSSKDTDNLICEHVYLNDFIDNIYLNPSMIYVVLVND